MKDLKYQLKQCCHRNRDGNYVIQDKCLWSLRCAQFRGVNSGAGYAQAMDEVSRSVPRRVFSSINSVPCFEYWLLLHFIFSTKSYTGAGAKSACACLIEELHKYIPGYSKGARGLFKDLMDQTDRAVANSERALQDAERIGTDNPSTLMHDLVEYLKHLEDDP
ncbi:MAG: RloB family protein [Gammaproteobacteria bacterium]